MKSKTTLLTKAATLLFVALFSLTGARAETLTVHDGTTTNSYVPVYGLWVDDYSRSQFVYEVAEIEDMANGEITGMTFYASQASIDWGNARFDVYLSEVSASTISSLKDWTTLEKVYSGSLSISGNQMTITFDTPYAYAGGNLLVGINQTTSGTYKSSTWYGEEVSGASMGGYGSSIIQRDFIPKTTFTYQIPTFPRPTNLAVSPTATQATVSWEGTAVSYNVRYRTTATEPASFFEDFENGFDAQGWTTVRNGGGTEYTDWRTVDATQFTGGTNHSGDRVAMSRSWSSSAYSVDNWLITPRVTLDGTLKYWVMDDGQYHEHYDIYVSTTGTNISDFSLFYEPGNASDTWTEVSVDLNSFSSQEGYIAFRLTDEDQDYLWIDDFGIYGDEIPAGAWTTISTTETSIVLTGLNPETDYEVEVQAVYADGESEWASPVTFVTTSTTAVPTDLAATDVKATSATLDWAGSQESYNLRYRQTSFFENFENVTGNSLPEGWTSIDNDGDDNNWYSVSVGALSGSNCATSASYQGEALTPDNWLVTPKVALDGTMSVWLRAQDPEWPAEHFAIYLSTTGTDVSDFTTTLVPETEATGEYVEYTADLSEYAGQEGYIAIRHFNVTDMFRLNVDDFFIGNNSWTTISGVTDPYTIEGLAPETSYQVQVQGILSDGTTEWSEMSSFTTLESPASVTIGATGYATFVAPSAVSFPSDVTAYIITATTGTSVTMEAVEAIPAGTAVVVKGEPGTYYLDAAASTDDVTSNQLQACTAAFNPTAANTIYCLANKDKGIGFYPVATSVTIPVGKAYLEITSKAKAFYGFFEEDDATAIDNLNANVDETIYNVAGQRISKAQKGINIINGKKVLK